MQGASRRLRARVGPAIATAYAPLSVLVALLGLVPPASAVEVDVDAGVEHRQRVELLVDDFRPGGAAHAAGWFLRTLAFWSLDVGPTQFFVEAIDSRALLDGAPPGTSHIDPVDLLQARARLHLRSVVVGDDDLRIDVGRMTLDLGSRRLVARNDFRNTISSFTGVDASWSAGALELRAFAVSPVRRLPTEADALLAHVLAVDVESGALLAGVQVALTHRESLFAIECGVLALDESLVPGGTAVADGPVRRLVTPVLRVWRRPATGTLDGQIEVAPQWGVVQAVGGTAVQRRALSVHASLGYRAQLPGAPRLVLAWDQASGDAAPHDDVDNRFDPLFGARRFEFGPTGLLGPFARSNLDSAGVRLEWQPLAHLDVLLGVRRAALAAPRDAWTTTGFRDDTGKSGRSLGDLVEARVRVPLVLEQLHLDVGGALFAPGDFARAAVGRGDDDGASTWFGYAALTAQLGRR
jgi:hypothetical protein